jgi:hypothetical protein
VWTGFNWFRIESSGGLRELGFEPSGSIKCVKILDQLNDCQLPKDSAPWSYLT